MAAKVLVLGGGGREHALAWKLSLSPHVSCVCVAPGNAGIPLSGRIARTKDVNSDDHASLVSWCLEKAIDLVVVGPEAPLANGIADSLASANVRCFGPSASAARIESSKKFAKEFMRRHGIPTARWETFDSDEIDAACRHIDEGASYSALVVKASGLAAGKGVVVARDKDEAKRAAMDMLQNKRFGSAGETIVIEEYLEGEEFSVLAFSDGQSIALMPPSQDHKRLLDNDEGPNTGGMGAYSPCPQVSSDLLEKIREDILMPAVKGLSQEGSPYVGVLYAGLMLTKSGPRVLEFNCRFGDPETQVLLPILESDLFTVMKACVDGRLLSSMPIFSSSKHCAAVVMASAGYPGSYPKGKLITGAKDADSLPGVKVFHAGTACNEKGDLVTAGGRVLAVSAVSSSLKEAVDSAYKGVEAIKFEGAQYRKDVASLGLKSVVSTFRRLTYESAGVDIAAGNALVDAIKPLSEMTKRAGCVGSLGGFGALFDCKSAGFSDPILVSGTDGVGTKLKVAQSFQFHETVGIDLVAMCANDVLAHGAEPLFFLDCFSTGKLDVEIAKSVISGIGEGCKRAGCALTGGETAEMPGMYQAGEYDLVGFVVGAYERGRHLPRLSEIRSGDCLIGLASSGLHSNGFSLVRKVVRDLDLSYEDEVQFCTAAADDDATTSRLGNVLLTPTRIYVRSVLPVLRRGRVKAFAHITGGGLLENIPRVLPSGFEARLDASSWHVQPIFGWLAKAGNIDSAEMAKTFNLGLGAVLVVGHADVDDVLFELREAGEKAWKVGSVEKSDSDSKVKISKLARSLQAAFPLTDPLAVAVARRTVARESEKKKVAVLISGTGTNLQALIDSTKRCNYAEIVLVVSNVPNVEGLKRAERADIPTEVIPHKKYKSRRAFDSAVHEALTKADVDIVCLAGFMRIVGVDFVNRWQGKLVNIHPSLLPSFPGMRAHECVLEAGVRVSGCTVHFVEEKVDAGAIIVQETVAVYPDDTVESLSARVKTAEHRAYPEALRLLATGKVSRGKDGNVVWMNS